MHTISKVTPLKNYKLNIVFDDKNEFIFDVKPYLHGEIFNPLKKKEQFSTVTIDKDLGTIVWKNGADFCPDFLYKEMLKQTH